MQGTQRSFSSSHTSHGKIAAFSSTIGMQRDRQTPGPPSDLHSLGVTTPPVRRNSLGMHAEPSPQVPTTDFKASGTLLMSKQAAWLGCDSQHAGSEAGSTGFPSG